MKTKRILFETLAVIVVTVTGMLLFPQASPLFAFIPIAYLLVEKRLRRRGWDDLGFRFQSFREDLRNNWIWFVLVGVIIQPLTAVLARLFLPAVFAHVKGRLPFELSASGLLTSVLVMAFFVFFEEMTYRNFFQGRLTPFVGAPIAVSLAAVLFAIVHFAPGNPAIVAFDLGTVFMDGILLGIIYARTDNITVTWAAHLLGNTLGLLALLWL